MDQLEISQRVSAGFVMYRIRDGRMEVFLAHPGGPYFAKKDEGHWSIPKGTLKKGEAVMDAAEREFEEETGIKPHGPYLDLGSIRQKGGKLVHAWAFAGEWDESTPHVCNTFKLEWPPLSGRFQEFPEIDRVGFFRLPEARKKLKESQHELLDRLQNLLHLM